MLAVLWQEETERLRAENRELCALAAGASNANANVQELRQALLHSNRLTRTADARAGGKAAADRRPTHSRR